MNENAVSRPKEWFATTHWTLVLTAANEENPKAEDALESLCKTYWYPLYAFARNKGLTSEDASDVTQSYFQSFLEKKLVNRVERENGRFRSYLLVTFRNFLSDQRKRSSRSKRGGGKPILSLDERDPEGRYLREPTDDQNPETLFEKRWTLALLEHVFERLESEYQRASRKELFLALKGRLVGEKGNSLSEIAEELNMTVGATGVALSRMRNRYGNLLREEIMKTVDTSDDIESELRHLLNTLT